jgi:ABC-type transport system involved in multi-copper enzyme maturation permease subunit
MIWTIARKEFLTSLLTYRFAFAFSASVLLMGLSAYALSADYAVRLDTHRAELIREDGKLEKIKVYALLKLYTHRPPSPLSIFSEGLEKRLGNILHFSHVEVPTMLTWRKENNPLMDAFPALDLATIAQLLFSLMALFFAYDAICGEREAGTLRLMGANQVPRHQILVGKWIGGMLCTALPALAGFLTALLIITTAPGIHFTADEWLRAGLIITATFAYISLFYLIGLCLSVRARLPATSLVLAILIWTLTTIVLPTAATYLIGETMPMRTEQAARETRERTGRELREELDGLWDITKKGEGYGFTSYRGSNLGTYIVGNGFVREILPEIQAFYAKMEPRRIEGAEEIARLEDRVMADRISQVETDRFIKRSLLIPAFSQAAASLAGTDLASFQQFIRYARQCRQSLVADLKARDVFSSLRFFTGNRLDEFYTRERTEVLMKTLREKREGERPPYRRMEDWDSIDLSLFPQFAEFRTTLADSLPRAAADLGILALVNVVLLLLALRWFLRRELV